MNHGYEIQRRIEELLGVPLPPGAVYVTLSRLEQAGLLTSSRVPGDPRGKKVYFLTPKGQAILSDWLDELRRLRDVIDRILGMV